jgi:predicted ATPase
MKTHEIRVKIEDFRAIKDADIILDGITVVAGENGAGKSTLSKLLYYIFKLSNEYGKLVELHLKRQLKEIKYFIDILNQEIITIRKGYNLSYSLENEDVWVEAVNFFNPKVTDTIEEARIKRLQNIIADILNDKKNIGCISFQEQLESLKKQIRKYFKKAHTRIEQRPIELLNKRLCELFSTNNLPKEYSILEYDSSVIDCKKEFLGDFHIIRNTTYIDTPMLLGINAFDNTYWDNTNNILKETPSYTHNKNIDYINTITSGKNILNGEAFYRKNILGEDRFIYKRKDDSEFNLLECATGIKAFAMLQMMLKSGFLNKYTLLIIDEPEVHLHPQWIVEYARLIVLLNKYIGVKFFIASHNPDMVSALKYISEKEETDENLNFYLAKRNKPGYTYSYKHLKTDIEPIFNSFNIALKKIGKYGI